MPSNEENTMDVKPMLDVLPSVVIPPAPQQPLALPFDDDEEEVVDMKPPAPKRRVSDDIFEIDPMTGNRVANRICIDPADPKAVYEAYGGRPPFDWSIPKSRVVRVSNMPKSTVEADLRHAFSRHGQLSYVRIIDSDVGLVEFTSQAYAEFLMHLYRGKKIAIWVKQRPVWLSYYKTKTVMRRSLESMQPTSVLLVRYSVFTRKPVDLLCIQRILQDFKAVVHPKFDYNRVLQLSSCKFVIEFVDVASAVQAKVYMQRDHHNNNDCCLLHVEFADVALVAQESPPSSIVKAEPPSLSQMAIVTPLVSQTHSIYEAPINEEEEGPTGLPNDDQEVDVVVADEE